MSTFRSRALQETLNRSSVKVSEAKLRSEYFASHVFNDKNMRQYLTREAYKGVVNAIKHGSRIDRKIADQVASSMKNWALTKGVTHYTHWFQPLTGGTAEKHDAFFELLDDGSPMEKFGGNG